MDDSKQANDLDSELEKNDTIVNLATDQKNQDDEHHSKHVHFEDNGEIAEEKKRKLSMRYNLSKIKNLKFWELTEPQRTPSGRRLSINARDNWGGKWEFFLSCLGFSVGLGNIWRFPYLAYENGGGAFLVPYIIMLLLSGKPMYFLELSLSQFSGKSCINIWSCAPIAKGVGIAMCLVTLCIIIYYNVILTYTIYYMFASLNFVLPWTNCNFEWAKNTSCKTRSDAKFNETTSQIPGEVYWKKQVLDSTDSLADLGGIKWDLFSGLIVSWIIIGACVINGIKSSGKVVYFASLFPYFVLIAFLICGLLQPGAGTGILYLITPSWKKLLNIEVWKAAAGQMFFSLGVSMGALISYSSYNDFHHNLYKDVILISLMDTFTSILAGFVIFSNLGSLALDLDVDVSEVVASGFGLAFVSYPESLNLLPAPQFWSFLFFFMLFTLGIDSEFALVENLLTSISDEFLILRLWKRQLCITVCIIAFILGIPCITRGGQYIINIMDYYGGGNVLVFIAIFECISFYWIYGYKNIEQNIQYMLNFKINKYWKITWGFTSPFILIFVFFYSMTIQTPLSKDPAYPFWADIIGWLLASAIMLQIPLWAIITILKQKPEKYLEKILMAIQPTEEWGPNEVLPENSIH